MEFELRAARQKLEKEQRERKEVARRRIERERKAKVEALRRREAIEESQRTRRLDEARARQIEEQKKQESLHLGDGIMFSRSLEALRYDGYGDKIKLPPSCFTELSDQGALDKGPMYFQLSRVHGSSTSEMELQEGNNRSTHCGVLEFTATESSVELPPHVWDNLFFEEDFAIPLVEVRYAKLPKGTYAKLQPLGLGFSDIPNHKAVLETSLRRHATLSQGDIITVKHAEFSFRLRVLELRPSSCVSVIETDVEVDVVEADASESRSQPSLTALTLGKSESGAVSEGEFRYYKFFVDEDASQRIARGDFDLEVALNAKTTEGDTDIYVSRHPVIFPTQHKHEWCSHDVGSKVLKIGSKEKLAGTCSVGIFGYKGYTEYDLFVVLKENKWKLGESSASTSSQAATDMVECSNCGRQITNQSIMIHEAYCRRHNVVCQHPGCSIVLRKEEAANHVHCSKCGQGLQRHEMEKHMKVFHQPITCSCGISLENKEMVEHQSSACPLRLITCRFCGDMVQAGSYPTDVRDRLRGLSEHESVCGSRTAPCHSCGRSIMLKDMEIHLTAVHQQS